MATPARRRATIEDLLERRDRDRLEIVGGEIVEKATPSPNHSMAEGKVTVALDPFNRRPGRGGPGGWWIFPEIHVMYPGGELYCHDLAGWRRERVPVRPTEWPIRIRPDWVCEIMSPKHEKHDLVDKPRVLDLNEVPHYWVLDPDERILLGHRWSPDGYVVVQRAAAGEAVRAEPFDETELRVSALFGDDDDDDDD